MYGIYPRCYEAKPSNPEGIPYTTASEESMWLVPQLTAFHQSQAEKSIPLGNTLGFRQLREQRFEKCGLCPITLHFSRPLIGGRQATVVQGKKGRDYAKVHILNLIITDEILHDLELESMVAPQHMQYLGVKPRDNILFAHKRFSFL